MRKIYILISVAMSLGALVGCASKEVTTQTPAAIEDGRASQPSSATTSTTPIDTPDATQTAIAPASTVTANPLTDPGSPLSQRSVYFDFDTDTVKEEYRSVLVAHGHYLVEHRDAKIKIQGNTDERGAREYNVALGQRRAEAVKKVLLLLGVKPDQVESVSFGEEKPRATAHDETAWAQNRRADIVYQGE